ncbi:MAG: membrane protein insertase YidC [Actinomycetota bacterium]
MGFFEVFAGALAAFYAVIPSYGLAIILLTITTRVLLLPLSIKQTKSMREMQVIQPEVKKIQTKYKSDPSKRNEEMMKLYKEHGVNPFGGCLPLVMQMPVFIGLYQVVRFNLKYMGYKVAENAVGFTAVATGGLLATLQGSKLAQDLLHPGTREGVNTFLGVIRLDCSLTQAWSGQPSETVALACGSGSPIIAVLPYVLMIAFMGFTTYYQQRQMMANRGPNDQQAQQMQMVGRIMPFILVVFGLQFPAGVLVYWIATNVWTIVQQRIILARFGPMPGSGATPKKTGKETGKPATTKKAKETAKNPKTTAKNPKATTKNARKTGGKKSTAGRAPSDGQSNAKSGNPSSGQKSSGSQSGNGSTQPSAGTGAGRKKRRR